MILYHGSGSTFDKFDFRFMSTGEGQQVHGWGVYLAKNKDVADGYRNAGRYMNHINPLIIIDGETKRISEFIKDLELMVYNPPEEYFDIWYEEVFSKLSNIIHNIANGNHVMGLNGMSLTPLTDKESILKYIRLNIEKNQDIVNYGKERNARDEQIKPYEEIIKGLNILKDWFDSHEFKNKKLDSMLATVELDDDIVLINENEEINQESQFYDKLTDIWNNLNHEPYWGDIEDSLDEYFKKNLTDSPDSYYYDTRIIPFLKSKDYQGLSDWIRQFKWGFNDFTPSPEKGIEISKGAISLYEKLIQDSYIPSFQYFFQWYTLLSQGNEPKDISLELLNHGIDGISYTGNSDGECVVLINLDKCKIIEKETD